jgi:hypothetical protein
MMCQDANADKIRRTLLYYPTISVPTGSWLRQAVLYWDEVASIVPEDLDQRPLVQFTDDIKLLKDNGEFRSIAPGSLIDKKSYSEVLDLEREFLEVIDAEPFQTQLGQRNSWQIDSRIHIDKVSVGLANKLEQRGLAKGPSREADIGDWYRFERSTALVYMSFLAQYLADIDPHLTTPSTDRKEYGELVYSARQADRGFSCADVLFRNVLPVPRDDVSIADLLAFKRKRHSELLNFRACVDEFQKKVANAGTERETREVQVQFKESIAKGVEDLSSLLAESRMSTIFRSLRAFVNVKKPEWLGVLLGTGYCIGHPVMLTVGGLAIAGAIEVGRYLIDARNQRRAALRDSTFAYMYYAGELT